MRNIKFSFITGIFFLFSLFSTNILACPWTFELAPYLWATNMNGRVAFGPASARIDQNFTNLLSHLDYGGMIYATAHKDYWGFYLNDMYVSLSDSGKRGPLNIHARNNFGILGAGISYIALDLNIADYQRWILEPYAGARYTSNDTKITVGGLNFKKNVNWTDPIIGIHSDYALDRCWGLQFFADAGGLSSSRQWSFNTAAFFDYQPLAWRNVKTYLGYRFIRQHYETGHGLKLYDWNMRLFGPVLGVGFVF